MSDADKLNMLADYFDKLDRETCNEDNHQVQDDLRRIANELEKSSFATSCMSMLVTLYSCEGMLTTDEFRKKAIEIIKMYMYN